jgi:hypothetical protein
MSLIRDSTFWLSTVSLGTISQSYGFKKSNNRTVDVYTVWKERQRPPPTLYRTYTISEDSIVRTGQWNEMENRNTVKWNFALIEREPCAE